MPIKEFTKQEIEEIKRLYLNPEIKMDDICVHFGVTRKTLLKTIKALGMPLREKTGRPLKKLRFR